MLFAIVDANYNFIYVDVGCQGRISDGGVFKNSSLYKMLEKGKLNIPPSQCLNERRNKEIPYVFIGDEAFAISPHLMKVYSGIHSKGSKERIYNYRLCRARRVVENVFGIVSSVFRILRKPMLLEAEKATNIVMAIVHLHNFLRRNKESQNIYSPPGSMDYEIDTQLIPGAWRNDFENRSSLIELRRVPRKSSTEAIEIRNELADYFVNEGQVYWQNNYA